MAVGTEEISSFSARKVTRPFSMDACPPVSIEVPMTFAAESVALREVDQFPIEEPKLVPILCIVAVKTPSHGLGVMKLDIGVFVCEFPFFPIYLHGGMTLTARKHPLCNRRRGNRKFLSPHGRRYEKKRQEDG